MTASANVSQALHSEDPEERRRATSDIPALAESERVELILVALADEDWRVRKEATLVARALAPSADVLEGLVRALSDQENVGLVNAAVAALAGFGADAVDALSVALRGFDTDARKLAAEALAQSQEPAALFVLRGMVDDHDANVRAAALEAVAQIGATAPEEAAAILQRCLRDEDPFQRLVALDGLNQLRFKLHWEQVDRLLRDPVLRRAALIAAGHSGNKAAVSLLANEIATTKGAAFAAALSSLGELVRVSEPLRDDAKRELRTKGQVVIDELVRVAADENDHLSSRRWAILLLGAFDNEACGDLIVQKLLDNKVFAEAEEALEIMGPTALAPLLRGARSDARDLSAACIQFVAKLVSDGGGQTHEVEEALLDALQKDDPLVKRSALEALSLVGGSRCLPALIGALDQTDVALSFCAEAAFTSVASRHAAEATALVVSEPPHQADWLASEPKWLAKAVVIEARGRAFPEATPFLARALAHESMRIRRAALQAIAHLRSGELIEEVSFALTDERREVRVAAIRALGAITDSDGAHPGLGKLLELAEQAEDPVLLAETVSALGGLGEPGALAALRRLAHAEAPLVAVRAVEAIAGQRFLRPVDELLDCLASPEPEVVKSVLRAFARSDDPRAVAHVGACLDHELWDVRRLVADLLGQLGGETNTRLLFAKLAVEKEPLVRDAIERALEAQGELRRTPMPARSRSILP